MEKSLIKGERGLLSIHFRALSSLFLFSGLFLLMSGYTSAEERIKVVTTLPVLKDFVERVGGERVEVKSLLSGLESEHTYSPKPSDVLTVQKARMLVKIGLGLEVWVNSLVKNANNKSLLTVTTSDGVPLLRNHENSQETGRQSTFKEKHSMGNPHIWLDPENAKIMIRHITEGLISIDPTHKQTYLKNQGEYFQEIDTKQAEIKRRVRLLSDRRIITHHAAWPYFARRFGFTISGDILLQVGSEPSARHLAGLIRTIRKEKIRVIISEPQLNPTLPRLIARETGAKIVLLSPFPGTLPGTETYLRLMEYNTTRLISALTE